MGILNIKSFLEKKQNWMLLSRYRSLNSFDFYIFIPKDTHYFINRFQDRDIDEKSSFFYAIPKEYKNNDICTIKYVYTVRYDVLFHPSFTDIDIIEYFKIYGLYHLKKYLDTITDLENKNFEKIVSRDDITNDEYKPLLSGRSLISPIFIQEKITLEENIRLRILDFLYKRKEIQRVSSSHLDNFDVLENVFCDEQELISADQYLLGEGLTSIPWRITTKGVKFVEDKNKSILKIRQNTAFVAQSFSKEILPYYDCLFSKAISNCGYKPISISLEEPERGIDSEIFKSIESCAFVIADLTLERPSVYLEAGYAIGKGIKVFFTARQDHNTDFPSWRPGNSKIHFDIRNYKITWWDSINLKSAYDELVERINSWLGIRK